MTTLNARASQAWAAATDGTTEEPFDGIPRDAFEEGWETGYKTAAREVSRQIEQEIQMYNQEWSANTWRSIAARIAREIGGGST